MSLTITERFAKRFAGLTRAHGRYVPDKAASGPKGKVDGIASTVQLEPTVELYGKHLTGEYGIGIVPIRDDSSAVFGAIDIDIYPLDITALNQDLRRMQLPLLVGRTKSGGAHLLLFAGEPGASAEVLREKLMNWAVVLGYGGVEVFPKQVKLASTVNDFGNWINLPYFGGDRSTRYVLHPDTGKAMTVEQFLDMADQYTVDPNELYAIEPLVDEGAGSEHLQDGPPCLQTLAVHGFPSGTRNNAMFNIAIFLKKAHPDEWTDMVGAYNERFMDPPLGPRELETITKSVNKKNYSYRCKESPINNACNRTVCLTRKFGVGGSNDDPGVAFGDLIKLTTDPITWIWDVNGHRVELTTDQLMDQKRFHERCVDAINKWPIPVKPHTWQQIVSERLAVATIVEVPVDATLQGQVMEWLARFATGRATARELDEVLLGKPYTPIAPLPPGLPTGIQVGFTYFRVTDFLQYLKAQRVTGVSEKKLYMWLRDMRAEHHFVHVKGKGVNVWSVPSFQEQTEAFTTPRAAAQGDF